MKMNALEKMPDIGKKDISNLRDEGVSAVRSKKESYSQKAISLVECLVARAGLSERRKDKRVPARELTATYWTDVEQKQARVKNLSPTGIYLLTDERWVAGTELVLTVQRDGRSQKDSEYPLRIRARVVRLGDDGAGLTFVHEHIDTAGWLDLISKAASMTPENNAVRVFRMAKALAYLLRISALAEDRLLKLLNELLSHERAERAIEIALRGEERAASRNCALKAGMFPGLLLRILTDGSKSHEEPMQQCWAGLLAASSLDGADDDENLSFAALLSRLEPIHIRILTAALQRASRTECESLTTPAEAFHCTMEELKQIAQTKNAAVVECALNLLYESGLLDLTAKPSGFEPPKCVNITPTGLGLKFCARCRGKNEVSEAINCTKLEALC